MKIQKQLTLVTIVVIILASCATATQKAEDAMLIPGDNIGTMTVEDHAMSTKYPSLWEYCSFQTENSTPGTQTLDCEVPLTPRMQVEIGWDAKDSTILDSNWDAIEWELHIDDHQINLDKFSRLSDTGRTDLGITHSSRHWIIDMNNLSPGKHTLRFLWKSEATIDDGYDVYQPGTYEYVVNLTVAEK